MKMKINYGVIAEEGVPMIMTVVVPMFMVVAALRGWVHGTMNMVVCGVLFCLCMWSLAYNEYKEVKGRVSKMLFGLHCLGFAVLLVGMSALYAVSGELSLMMRLVYLAAIVVPSLLVNWFYHKSMEEEIPSTNSLGNNESK